MSWARGLPPSVYYLTNKHAKNLIVTADLALEKLTALCISSSWIFAKRRRYTAGMNGRKRKSG